MHNNIIDTRCNQITDMIKESEPPITGHLDNDTCMYYNPLPFFGENNTTEDLQRGGRGYGWFTDGDTSCMNASINLPNVDNSTLYTEGNVCGIIAIPVVESTFDKEYINIIHGISK